MAAVASPFIPAVSSSKRLWVDRGAVGVNFGTMGWSPEGEVYFDYLVIVGTVGAGTGRNEFFAHADADLDGNGTQEHWAYVHPVPAAAALTAAAVVAPCVATGVWNPSAVPAAANLLNTVGPCDAVSGQSVF